MTEVAGVSGLEPTEDDRTMATLAHALAILGFIPPLVIFLVKRQSRFVSFHALQSLLWHIAYFAIIMVAAVGWVVMIFFTIAQSATSKGSLPPTGLFVLIPLFWLLVGGAGVLNLVFSIVYCIKASQGEWADFPIFGGIARRLLKMGPRGAGIN
jgi:uncharacterized membrane protein